MSKARVPVLAAATMALAAGAVLIWATILQAVPPKKPGPKPKAPPPKGKLPPKLPPRVGPKALHPRVLPRVRPLLVRRVGPAIVLERSGAVVRRPPAVTVIRSADSLAAVPTTDFAHKTAYKVAKVDANYVVVLKIDGKDTPVRLIGLSPVQAELSKARAAMLAEQIERFVHNLLAGEFVYLDSDPQLAEQDEDGRTVAYLYRAPEGLLVNLEIVRQGYALADDDYEFQHSSALQFYEQKARADQKGLWGMLEAE